MLEICITVLLITWLLGLLSSYTLGGGIHLCLVLALVFLAVKLLSRRAPSPANRAPTRVKPDRSFS